LLLYDVKNEWLSDIVNNANEKMQKGLNNKFLISIKATNPLEKICCYKICDTKVDCDVSLRNIVIYSLAFGLENVSIKSHDTDLKKYCLSGNDFEYIGDTMNSYATSIRSFLRKYNQKTDIYKRNSKELKQEYQNIGGQNSWEACILDNLEYYENLLPLSAKNFISVNHTIGNFLPVPCNFNIPRYSKTKDYWDLTLKGIHEWFLSDTASSNGIEDIIDGTGIYSDIAENVRVCKLWLSQYKNWDEFVEKNFMQDFVNTSYNNGKYGGPKELWNGHFANNPVPNNEAEFGQFFENSSSWILARGNRIVIKIKDELSKKTDQQIINCLL
jgi:hypothetical protein